MRRHPATVIGTAVALLATALFAAVAQGHPGSSHGRYEQVVFVDPARPFHGGPPPHTATDAASDFRLAFGGSRWLGLPKTVKYSVSTAGCTDDCGDATNQLNSGLDAWEVSGVTYTQDNVSPSANPCTPGSGNSISWISIDGGGGTLAAAFTCRTVVTKEIVGFRVFFDSDDTWSDSGDAGKFDIAATGAHEGGHTVGLNHVNAPRARKLTMFFTGGTGETFARTLGCGDRLGVNALYSAGLDCSALPGD